MGYWVYCQSCGEGMAQPTSREVFEGERQCPYCHVRNDVTCTSEAEVIQSIEDRLDALESPPPLEPQPDPRTVWPQDKATEGLHEYFNRLNRHQLVNLIGMVKDPAAAAALSLLATMCGYKLTDLPPRADATPTEENEDD